MRSEVISYATVKSFISGLLVLLIIIILSLPSTIFAQHPYDSYDAPVDAVVAWFYDYCNQNQQVRAFWMITKNGDGYPSPYQMVEIKPEFDLPVVRDAFVFYLRSVTVDKQTAGCSQFLPSYWLGSDVNIPNEWEGYSIQMASLSLYMNLGYTQDLFEIADSCYGYGSNGYFAFLVNRLGANYLLHLETEIQTDPTHLLAIDIAGDYLNMYSNPLPTKRIPALNILHLAAISTSREQRRWVTFLLCDVYLKGYQEVRADILLLTDDSDEGVMNGMRGKIRAKQYYSHQMMNFLKDEE